MKSTVGLRVWRLHMDVVNIPRSYKEGSTKVMGMVYRCKFCRLTFTYPSISKAHAWNTILTGYQANGGRKEFVEVCPRCGNTADGWEVLDEQEG